MGWERPSKRKKKNLVPNSVPTQAKLPFPKKIAKKFKKLKNIIPTLFLTNWDEIGWEGEEKILVPNSVHAQPGEENFKKNSKKNNNKKKKPLSGIIFNQNGMR